MQPRAPRGTALLNALIVLAAIAALSITLTRRDVEFMARFDLMTHSNQAWHQALTAERLASSLLEQDWWNGVVDHPGEAWATTEQVFEMEGGVVSGRIVDLRGRLDLNTMASRKGEAPDSDALARLQRLLEDAGGNAGLADRIAEWVSPPDADIPGAAGAAAYRAAGLPHRPPFRPMAAPSELRAVVDMPAAVADRLIGQVAALDGSGKININTATDAVLAALAPNLTPAEIDSVKQQRRSQPFSSREDFLDRAADFLNPLALEAFASAPLVVASDWFMIEVEAHAGRGMARLFSVVHRSAEDGTAVLRLRVDGSP